jgi:uncharacterized protein
MSQGVKRKRNVAKRDVDRVVEIIRAAGGRIVGRTRLQKVAYLRELAGLGSGFKFDYHHYGPYSEDLADAARNAGLLDLLEEKELPTDWGGFYSIFTVEGCSEKQEFTDTAAGADPIELELAATAAFLAREGIPNPWKETARRKPVKAGENRLEGAKKLYLKLCRIETPERLPEITDTVGKTRKIRLSGKAG